jgi:alkyl hydroperoxide reductase subunit AhpC
MSVHVQMSHEHVTQNNYWLITDTHLKISVQFGVIKMESPDNV